MARAAAGRTALESVAFAPASVLPEYGVDWRAERLTVSWWYGTPRKAPCFEASLEATTPV